MFVQFEINYEEMKALLISQKNRMSANPRCFWAGDAGEDFIEGRLLDTIIDKILIARLIARVEVGAINLFQAGKFINKQNNLIDF